MKLIKSKPRYKCDFCSYTKTKQTIEKHEPRCFRNPNRYCDFCGNSGIGYTGSAGYEEETECPYCLKLDKTLSPLPIEPKEL